MILYKPFFVLVGRSSTKVHRDVVCVCGSRVRVPHESEATGTNIDTTELFP